MFKIKNKNLVRYRDIKEFLVCNLKYKDESKTYLLEGVNGIAY